jgi:hypothetical protein
VCTEHLPSLQPCRWLPTFRRNVLPPFHTFLRNGGNTYKTHDITAHKTQSTFSQPLKFEISHLGIIHNLLGLSSGCFAQRFPTTFFMLPTTTLLGK